jgi:protein phosphatase-4 regulatory subunit 3
MLDEQTFSSLSSIAFFNQSEIVAYIQKDQSFQIQIFAILSEENLSAQKRKDVVMFLHELSVTVKGLHVQSKAEFFRSLASHGLFAIFEYTIGDQDIDIRIAIISLLTNILENEAGLVRSFCLAQARQNQKTLIETVIDRLLTETDSGLRSQLSEIIRMMIDTIRVDAVSEGIVHHTTDAEDFLNLFYENYVSQLAHPIMSLNEEMIVVKHGITFIDNID